jgi:UDP-N-acetylmuramyl pentapeptide phosphotransferase/UDP-N-acetylglucosamine-1-phosphate transferase
VALIVALVVALAATPLAMRAAVATGVVDHPGPLKVQQASVPYLGGVAVFAGIAVVLAFVHPALLLPLALAALLGLIDDARGLPAGARLLGEIGVGAVAAAVVPVRFGAPFGPVAVVVVVVVLVNAVNMLDGLDGLAAGVAIISAAGFAALLRGDGRATALAIVGALGAFLWFNRPPARIYLGDAGSYMVGTALALLLATAWSPHRKLAVGFAALALVALPAIEVVVAVIRRLRARQVPFGGDRGHVYDQLVDRGWSAGRASLGFAIAQLGLAAIAVVASSLSSAPAAVIAIGSAGVVFLALVAAGFTRPEYRRESA